MQTSSNPASYRLEIILHALVSHLKKEECWGLETESTGEDLFSRLASVVSTQCESRCILTPQRIQRGSTRHLVFSFASVMRMHSRELGAMSA